MMNEKKYILKGLLFLSLLAVGSVFFRGLLRVTIPVGGVQMVDYSGKTMQTTPSYTFVSLDELPQGLLDMIVYLEDKRFWTHWGVDLRAVVRALQINISLGTVQQGASTIDQQLVKIGREAYDRNFRTKLYEQLVATLLNVKYTKKDILLSYINVLPFPYGTQGLGSGCLLYFGKGCEKLYLSQQLFIVASFQLGDNGFTRQGFSSIKQRSLFLCNELTEGGFVSAGDCVDWEEKMPQSVFDLQGLRKQQAIHAVRYFLSIDQKDTSYNLALHNRIENIIDSNESHRKQINAQDCCVVVLNAIGDVASMNVCRDWDDPIAGTVNGCLMQRQTGSAVKPFVYLHGMKQLRLDQGDSIEDSQISFALGNGGVYAPKNFDLKTHGEVTLAQALGSSLNIPAVKILHEAGINNYMNFFSTVRTIVGHDLEALREDNKRFSPLKQGLSLALGTYEMSPLAFAQTWRVFGDLYTNQSLGSLHAYDRKITEIRSMLSTPENTYLSFDSPTHHILHGWATKTGTSRNFIDGRTCGVRLISDEILCVRMGNYDSRPMKEAGSKSAAVLRRLIAEEMQK